MGLSKIIGVKKPSTPTSKWLIGRDITDDEIREMTRKCSRDFTATCGQLKVLTAADMEAIYHMAR